MTSSRCGGRSCLSTVVAAAASGGATMAPRAIAAPQGMSGTITFATAATTAMGRAAGPQGRGGEFSLRAGRHNGDGEGDGTQCEACNRPPVRAQVAGRGVVRRV